MAKYRFIKTPTRNTIEIIKRRLVSRDRADELDWTAVGLVQCSVADIIYASDVAEKTSDIIALELSGTCPQHITTLALFGETAAVDAALESVKRALAETEC